MTTSASQLMRNCGHPRALGKTRVRSPSAIKAADNGTEFHRLVPSIVLGRSWRAPERLHRDIDAWLQTAARVWRPRPDALCEMALGLSPQGRWVDVEETEPHVYVPRDGKSPLLTAGRADVAWHESGVAVIIDHKTGRSLPEHASTNPQLWALGLAFADMVGATSLRTAIYFARTGQFQWHPGETSSVPLDSEEAAMRWDDVIALAELDDSARPGPWCGGCWERKGCGPAHEQGWVTG